MRILLIGEYSLLHTTLKEGLTALGHEVFLIGNSDGFKKYPVDYDFEAKWLKLKFFNLPRKIFYFLFKFDLAGFEYGIRFWLKLGKLKNYDVVQFVNESAVKTTHTLEFYFLKKIYKNNKKCFMISSGIDYNTLKFYIENKEKKSILQPYFQNKKLKEFIPFFIFFDKKHKTIHDFIEKNFNGIIATDFDYVEANQTSPAYVDFIPCPVNLSKLIYQEPKIKDKIIIFLGINKYSYNQKGIPYFEKALEVIKEKYPEKVEILIANTVPYPQYMKMYDDAHILLDQLWSCDQGYNALEAMAKGKVVFTGSEKEFLEYYKLQENEVVINALPDVNYLVKKLSFLIENPQEITAIGKRARAFIEKEHNYIKIAEKYIEIWKK